jgi:hypothetical protein
MFLSADGRRLYYDHITCQSVSEIHLALPMPTAFFVETPDKSAKYLLPRTKMRENFTPGA